MGLAMTKRILVLALIVLLCGAGRPARADGWGKEKEIVIAEFHRLDIVALGDYDPATGMFYVTSTRIVGWNPARRPTNRDFTGMCFQCASNLGPGTYPVPPFTYNNHSWSGSLTLNPPGADGHSTGMMVVGRLD